MKLVYSKLTATIMFICIDNDHAVLVSLTFVHVCLHLYRLINLLLAILTINKEINVTCSYSYQYTEYKAIPNRNYTTVCILSPIK